MLGQLAPDRGRVGTQVEPSVQRRSARRPPGRRARHRPAGRPVRGAAPERERSHQQVDRTGEVADQPLPTSYGAGLSTRPSTRHANAPAATPTGHADDAAQEHRDRERHERHQGRPPAQHHRTLVDRRDSGTSSGQPGAGCDHQRAGAQRVSSAAATGLIRRPPRRRSAAATPARPTRAPARRRGRPDRPWCRSGTPRGARPPPTRASTNTSGSAAIIRAVRVRGRQLGGHQPCGPAPVADGLTDLLDRPGQSGAGAVGDLPGCRHQAQVVGCRGTGQPPQRVRHVGTRGRPRWPRRGTRGTPRPSAPAPGAAAGRRRARPRAPRRTPAPGRPVAAAACPARCRATSRCPATAASTPINPSASSARAAPAAGRPRRAPPAVPGAAAARAPTGSHPRPRTRGRASATVPATRAAASRSGSRDRHQTRRSSNASATGWVWTAPSSNVTAGTTRTPASHSLQAADLPHLAPAAATTREVDHDVERGHQLAVHGRERQPGGQRERLDPARYVGRRVGVHGAAAALVPGVQRGQEVDHLGPAHLPDDQPVGPHPQRLPDQVAQRDAPAPSTLAGRASRPTTCGWSGRAPRRPPRPRARSVGSTSAEQRVEQRRLAGARASASPGRPAGPRRSRAATPPSSAARSPPRPAPSRVNARRARTRSESTVPVRATGGRTACSRVPSGSRASTHGMASSSRRPAEAASRCASRRTGRVVAQAGPAIRSSPRPRSTQTRVRTVDQDVGHLGVRSSGSSGPAPTTSRRSASCTASTVGVAHRAAALAQGPGHPLGGQLRALAGQLVADLLQHLVGDRGRAHAASADGRVSRAAT